MWWGMCFVADSEGDAFLVLLFVVGRPAWWGRGFVERCLTRNASPVQVCVGREGAECVALTGGELGLWWLSLLLLCG